MASPFLLEKFIFWINYFRLRQKCGFGVKERDPFRLVTRLKCFIWLVKQSRWEGISKI